MRSITRPGPQTLAAGLLAIGGATTIVYAGFLPIPPFSDVPVPLVWQVLGVLELAAAVVVYRGRTWGRMLGLSVVSLGLVLAIVRAAAQGSGSDALGVLMSLAVSVAYSGLVLWLLFRVVKEDATDGRS